jgi:hypothetical protein
VAHQHQHQHDDGHAHGRPLPENSAPAAGGGHGNAALQEELGMGGPRPGEEQGFQHTVERGDTLWQLADDYLGAGRRWREIYALNREVIGDDPNLILPGQVFVIPTTPVAPDTSAGPVVEEASEEASGGSTPDLPTAGDTGEMCVPYVVLARGGGANAGAVTAQAAEVRTLVEDWGGTFSADRVTLAAEDTAGGRESVVALVWDYSWGDLPTNAEVVGNLLPVESELALTAMRALDGWGEVESGIQGQLEALIGGEINMLSEVARTVLWDIVNTAGSTSASAQGTALEGLFTNSGAKPTLVDEPVADLTAANHTLTGPTTEADHPFSGAVADAEVYKVTFDDGQEITIYAPSSPDASQGVFHTVQEAVYSLVRVPLANRQVIRVLNLNAVPNPDDAYWKVEYSDPNFESYMTAGASGTVDVYPTSGSTPSQDYMTGTMVHESGHTWSYQTWGNDEDAGGWVTWREAMVSDRTSVSGYADNAIAEDVAETVQVYNTTKDSPSHDEYRAMVPERFKILDPHFQ